jgi:hypothetical protein
MVAIVDEPFANQRMVLEQWCRPIADEEVYRRVGKRTSKVLEQRGRQDNVTKSPELNDKHLTRVRDARELHSGSRHSFAYWTKA